MSIYLKVNGVEYELNNNSNKFERAKNDAGQNASPNKILAHYDKLGGLIKLDGISIGNGTFWNKEVNRVIKKERVKSVLSFISNTTKHPIVATIVIAFLLLFFYYLLGIDLRSFI